MHLEADREALVECSQAVLRVVSPRATHPVLGGVRITAGGGKVELAATDLEIFVAVTEEFATEEEGVVVLPGKLFGEVLRSLPSGRVSVQARGGEAVIRGGKAEFSLTTLTVEDFPEFAEVEDRSQAAVEAAELSRALRQVVRAASTDEVRPVLTGVLWSFGEGSVRLVATDSYRLALREVALKEGPPEGEMIVPGRALGELGRHLGSGGGAGEVTIRVGEAQAVCEVGRTRLVTRLIEGEFPKYRQLVPEGYPNRLSVNRAEFAQAVQRVSVVAGTNTPVKIHLGDEVRLTAVEAGVGEAAEVLEGAAYEGEAMVVAFNPRFLGEGLDAVEGEQAILEVSSPTKPGVLRGEDRAEFTYIAMPVRLSR
jgi:DNA polymerase-3 subunit beta